MDQTLTFNSPPLLISLGPLRSLAEFYVRQCGSAISELDRLSARSDYPLIRTVVLSARIVLSKRTGTMIKGTNTVIKLKNG